jgi:adenylosuccinate synthase
MSVTVVLGTQWGDEGKGKAVDVLAREFDFVARFNGGNNAGHTLVTSKGTFKFHLIPSGILQPRARCLIGGGVVMDPGVLLDEINALRDAGVSIEKRLFISRRAHLILPYHNILDGLYEEAKGAGATGTTRRGIGPAFADKASYNGLRWSDVADAPLFADKLRVQLALKNKIIVALGSAPLEFQKIYDEYRAYYETLKPYIVELYPIIEQGLRAGKKFLLEQAQGALLDPDWGTYPFVTASTTLASAATAGLGIPPRAITRIIGVTKAYTTRVGGGPLPTEVTDDERSARALQEIAATTGRIRRGGWFDAEVVRFAARLNGVDALFLTKLDILSQFETIRICVGYEFEGRRAHYADLDAYQLARARPIYRTLRGWQCDITHARKFSDLPPRARQYVETIEKLVGVPVRWISVGPAREATIKR